MFIEIRTYLLKPGATAAFEERFVEGLSARQQFSKLGGLWRSEVGGLNQVVHIWPYESFEERERTATLFERGEHENIRACEIVRRLLDETLDGHALLQAQPVDQQHLHRADARPGRGQPGTPKPMTSITGG